jgi:hypothetical protein
VVVKRDGSVAAYVEVKAAPGGVTEAELPTLPPDHLAPLAPAARKEAALSLQSLFESYAEEAQLSPATVKRWAPLIARFTAHLGHDDPRAVRRQDVVAWKDSLLRENIANLTIRDAYLASVRATLQFGVDQGRLDTNPAAGVRVRVRKALQEREKGFDAEEADIILRATLRRPSGNASAETAAARRWIPWICAYNLTRVMNIVGKPNLIAAIRAT